MTDINWVLPILIQMYVHPLIISKSLSFQVCVCKKWIPSLISAVITLSSENVVHMIDSGICWNFLCSWVNGQIFLNTPYVLCNNLFFRLHCFSQIDLHQLFSKMVPMFLNLTPHLSVFYWKDSEAGTEGLRRSCTPMGGGRASVPERGSKERGSCSPPLASQSALPSFVARWTDLPSPSRPSESFHPPGTLRTWPQTQQAVRTCFAFLSPQWILKSKGFILF